MPDDAYAPEVLVVRDSDGTQVRREVRLAGRDKTPGELCLFIAETLVPGFENINIHDYIAVTDLQKPAAEPVAAT